VALPGWFAHACRLQPLLQNVVRPGTEGPQRAVKLLLPLHQNGGFVSVSGPSRGDAYMCGFRPTEASEAVVSYVRNTSSTPAVG
jgi:hypothetical protein